MHMRVWPVVACGVQILSFASSAQSKSVIPQNTTPAETTSEIRRTLASIPNHNEGDAQHLLVSARQATTREIVNALQKGGQRVVFEDTESDTQVLDLQLKGATLDEVLREMVRQNPRYASKSNSDGSVTLYLKNSPLASLNVNFSANDEPFGTAFSKMTRQIQDVLGPSKTVRSLIAFGGIHQGPVFILDAKVSYSVNGNAFDAFAALLPADSGLVISTTWKNDAVVSIQPRTVSSARMDTHTIVTGEDARAELFQNFLSNTRRDITLVENFRKILEIINVEPWHPENAEPLRWIADIVGSDGRESRGDYALAIEIFQTIATKFPHNSEAAIRAQLKIGDFWSRSGDKDAARRQFETVLMLDQNEPQFAHMKSFVENYKSTAAQSIAGTAITRSDLDALAIQYKAYPEVGNAIKHRLKEKYFTQSNS